VRNELQNGLALLSAILLTISSILPVAKARRAIAQWITIVIIFVIIVAGVVVIAAIVLFPGGVGTTTIPPYP